jgi:hypothetical protein
MEHEGNTAPGDDENSCVEEAASKEGSASSSVTAVVKSKGMAVRDGKWSDNYIKFGFYLIKKINMILWLVLCLVIRK